VGGGRGVGEHLIASFIHTKGYPSSKGDVNSALLKEKEWKKEREKDKLTKSEERSEKKRERSYKKREKKNKWCKKGDKKRRRERASKPYIDQKTPFMRAYKLWHYTLVEIILPLRSTFPCSHVCMQALA
jgi:hypothetical protein